jgi:hypothetical protein
LSIESTDKTEPCNAWFSGFLQPESCKESEAREAILKGKSQVFPFLRKRKGLEYGSLNKKSIGRLTQWQKRQLHQA